MSAIPQLGVNSDSVVELLALGRADQKMQLFFLNQNLPDLSLSHKVTEATLAYDGFGGRKGAEVGFLKGQTKLQWHLG